jgi:hypothetical protein
MLVTDLSQSPDVEVLSTDRLVQILGSMTKLEDRQISVRHRPGSGQARRRQARHAGSYIKAARRFASTSSCRMREREDPLDRARRCGQRSDLFPTMDDLTRRLKARLPKRPGRPCSAACLETGAPRRAWRSIAISRTSRPRRWKPTGITPPASSSRSARATTAPCRSSKRRPRSIRTSRSPT